MSRVVEVPRFTDQGCVALGGLIRRDRLARSWSLQKLQQLLNEMGVEVSESTLQRLEKPQPGKHPDWEIINAIAILGLVVSPVTKQPFTTEELMLIACEWIDPLTGQTKQGSTVMTAEQPNEFVRMVQQQYPTPAELAAASGLSEEEAAALYQGKAPGVILLGLLAPVLERKGGGTWRTEELQEFRDRVWGLVPRSENPPALWTQEDGHHVENGSSK